MASERDTENDIAIVGWSGAFPGSRDIEEFWGNILAGKRGSRFLSEKELQDAGIDEATYTQPNYVNVAASMSHAKCFDAEFFGYNSVEAESMDPQHRVFLEHCWLAMENAGYIPDEYKDLVGVFAGCSMNRYLLNNLDINTQAFSVQDFQKMLASEKDFLASRVSYKLNLKGPSINVQSACSTSLLAVQMGVLSLQTFQCDLALCGGVTINVPHNAGYLHSEGMIFSDDGYCRPFSSEAKGTVFGEGVGVVVLKRFDDALEEGDNVIAVIRGAAVNNDGRNKVGFTAPSVEGQAEVIGLAHDLSGIEASQVHFIETHGTATKLGDPIELEGLHSAFGDCHGEPYCALGTLKANIGHLDAAAGIASLIKAALVAHHRIIPPNVHSDGIFPRIEQKNSPFYFNLDPVDLTAKVDELIAGVSSFGVGGTNVHAILTSPPSTDEIASSSRRRDGADHTLLFMSAKSERSVLSQQTQIMEYLQRRETDYVDVNAAALTLLKHRKYFDETTFILATRTEGGEAHLKPFTGCVRFKPEAGVAFAFSGQGSQYEAMSLPLYEKVPLYRAYVDQCLELATECSGVDFRATFFSERSALHTNTAYAQVNLFVVEYSLARTLMDFGVEPSVLIGHSLGEYIAACIAGIFSLKDALAIVVARGAAMAKSPKGAMLTVFKSRAEVEQIINDKDLSVSIENAPENTVVSGSQESIEYLIDELDRLGARFFRLKNEHAFHSHFMNPVLEEFEHAFDSVDLSPARIHIESALEGYSVTDMNKPKYWVQHLRREVNFAKAVMNGFKGSKIGTVVEIGPGSALCSFVRAGLPDADLLLVPTIPTEPKKNDSLNTYFEALGLLWCRTRTVRLDIAGLDPQGTSIRLPGYQFERKEYWLSPKVARVARSSASRKTPSTGSEILSYSYDHCREMVVESWSSVFGAREFSDSDHFFDLGGESLSLIQLTESLSKLSELRVRPVDIIANPTVGTLATWLTNNLGVRTEALVLESLFKVDERGTLTPLFLVAGAHGDRYYEGAEEHSSYEDDFFRYFSNLTQQIGGVRPIYGFKPRGISSESEMHGSVEAMAKDYITEMKTIQPEGPYYIGGECVGGLVAYEIAHQLKARGEEVLFLLMMDTPFPSQRFVRRELGSVLRGFYRGEVRSFLQQLKAAPYSQRPKLTLVAALAALRYFAPLTKKMRREKEIRYGSYEYLKTLLKYTPKPLPVAGAILANTEWMDARANMGWNPQDIPNIKIMTVNGDHKTRLTTHGKELGKIINDLLLT